MPLNCCTWWVQVTLTTALRPHDMGVLALGWESFAVPGKSTNFSLGPAICPSGCTRRFSAPINVVGDGPAGTVCRQTVLTAAAHQQSATVCSPRAPPQVSTMLHMHQIGTSMVTQHVRATSELRPLQSIRYYQFG